MVRDVDLESTVMRRPKGAAKRPGECPFCRGKIIGSRRAPKPGETILQREVKPKTDQRHLYIRFLKSTPHPEGFYLPCCFLDEAPIKLTNPGFDKIKAWGAAPKTAPTKIVGRAAAAALEEDEEEGVLTIKPYAVTCCWHIGKPNCSRDSRYACATKRERVRMRPM